MDAPRASPSIRTVEASFAVIAEAATHPIVVCDRERRVVFANPVAAAALNADGPSLRGRRFGELYPDRLGWAVEAFERALRDDQPTVHEHSVVVKGRALTLLSVVQMIRTEDAEPLLAINDYDITDLRASEQGTTLEARLLDSVGQAVIATDVEGRLIYWNRFAEQLYGWRRDEALGRNVRDLTVTSALEEYSEAIMARAAQGESWRGEYEARRRDGSTFPAAVTLSPVVGASGEPMGLVGVSIDLTERKRVQRDLRRASNLESLSLLAGGIAHDFNNLMTGVIGNLSLLESLLEGADPEVREVADEARLAADRTRGLANQLLTFALGGTPARSPTNVGQLLRQTAGLVVVGSPCHLTLDIDPALPEIAVDPAQIGQVFESLVRNAVESMSPGGGTVRIEARVAPPDERHDGPRLRVIVEDEGVGIAAEAADRLFDPYYTTKLTGHGLGLAIAHSIVARHGGQIDVASTPGSGARFIVHLPAAQTDAERAPSPAPVHSPRGGGRVLLMDDDPPVHATVRRMLEHLGYEMTGACDGGQALELYARAMREGAPFDLVSADLTVRDGRGGREIIEELLQIDPRAYVVIVSGFAWDPVLSSFAEYGFSDRLRKPVSLEELRAVLARFEDRRGSSPE